MTALPTFATEANALQVDVNNNQVLAANSAATATAQATSASNSANLAASSAGAILWVSGTTYSVGATVISPANVQTYRRLISGAGTTDPSLDPTNWVSTSTGITKVNSYTSSATLTSATIGYIYTAMTTLGQSVTLPAANTLLVGGPLAIIDNTKGSYPVGIRDNTGVLIMAVAAGGEAYISLKDKSTVAGVWSVTGTNLEPGLITLDSTFSSTYSSTILVPFIALDNNTSIHFAALSAGFAAFVVDNLGKVVSTPVTVSSTASDAPVQVFKITSTTAIVFYGQIGTATHKAVVLTLTGTSPSLSLSVGTPQTLTTAAQSCWGGENFTSAPLIAQLTSTLFVSSYASLSTVTATVAISVSGTVITIGTPVNIITSSCVVGSTVTYALTSSTALVLYKSGSGTYTNNAVVISVSGTTCTIGTPAAIGGTSSNSTPPSSVLLSATKCIVSDDANAVGINAFTVTISGTTVTAGTNLLVESSMTSAAVAYTSNSATRYNPHLWLIGANTAGLWYFDSSGVSRAVVLTESGGTITAGTILYKSISQASSDASGYGYILPQGTGEFSAVVERLASTAGYANYVTTCKISGTSITNGGSALVPLSPSRPERIHITRMSTGKYVGHGVSDNFVACIAMPVFSSNGDSIAYAGTINSPAMAGGGTPVIGVARSVSSNRIVMCGNTLNGTTVSSSGAQIRLLNVEIAT